MLVTKAQSSKVHASIEQAAFLQALDLINLIKPWSFFFV
jgi:hypothetical protein